MFDTKHFYDFVWNGSACFPSNNRLKVLGTGTAAPSFSKDGWSGLHWERLGTKIIVKILWLTTKYREIKNNYAYHKRKSNASGFFSRTQVFELLQKREESQRIWQCSRLKILEIFWWKIAEKDLINSSFEKCYIPAGSTWYNKDKSESRKREFFILT